MRKNPRLAVCMDVPVSFCTVLYCIYCDFVPPYRRRFVINRVKCASQVCAGRMQRVGEMSTYFFLGLF